MDINLSDVNFKIRKARFSLKYRISLYERIASFLDSGIDIISSLTAIRNRYKQRNDFRYHILDDWLVVMDRGGNFADAIFVWVPAAEHMLISAGERGVGLITGLREATVLSEASAKNKSALIGGLFMPIVLFCLFFVMMIGFRLKMAPVFITLLPVERWPESGKILFDLSDFLTNFWFLLFGVILALVFIISSTIGRWKGHIREKFDNFPPWSIYRSYQASSFLIALSSLMKAGVPAYEALKLVNRTASPWMRVHLSRMMNRMKVGGGASGEALDTGLLDDETAGDVQDYSRLGNFHEAIYVLGGRSLEESVKKITLKMAGVKNFLFAMIAMCIIWIYGTTLDLQTSIAENQDKMTQSR